MEPLCKDLRHCYGRKVLLKIAGTRGRFWGSFVEDGCRFRSEGNQDGAADKESAMNAAEAEVRHDLMDTVKHRTGIRYCRGGSHHIFL